MRFRRSVVAPLLVALVTLAALPSETFAQPKPPPASSATIADARKLGDAFAAVAAKASPSVVQIDVVAIEESTNPLGWLRDDGVSRGMGSGVIYTTDGAILTNNHVIEQARSITVRLLDGRALPARLVGRDPSTDLAVLKIDGSTFPAATFADSEAAKVGEWVIAIGSPFGLGYTVTVGVLSAKGRGGVGVNAVEDYLQTDASINPGNSGGPLVNLDGQVLGINTMIVSHGQGIGLAVPSLMARRVADQILKRGRVERAWIGFGIQDLTPALAREINGAPVTGGAVVNSVSPGGPAAKANLEPGDVVTSLALKPVKDAQDVIREVFLHDAGEVVPLEVIRRGKRYQTKVTLEPRVEAPPTPIPMEQGAPSSPGLGIALRDVTEVKPPPGQKPRVLAQIVQVVPGSPADRAGIASGDVVIEVDGRRDPDTAAVQAEAKDGRVLLRIQRGTSTFYVAVAP
jgi:serine protease Do